MEIAAALLPDALRVVLGLLALAVLLVAAVRAPWRALLAVGTRQHLLFAVVLSLALLWSMALHPAQGITLHYLGMTSATLLLGPAFAMIAGFLALLLLVVAGLALPESLPVSWLLTVVLPALVVQGELALLARTRLRNLFVFLLGVNFLGAMAVSLVFALGCLGTLALAGQHGMVAAALDNAMLLPLLLFSEGFLNGAAMATLTVHFPHMVRGFDEDRFLGGP